jgi:hypothetical protein
VTLRAPFPWFGGKSRVAPLVWERFGDVPNYVEPFAGSLAVLLGRPHAPRTETVNDRDAYLSNFWRALQADPDGVAAYADAPVNEADLHARHLWLLQQRDFRERMLTEPDYFDVKVAGWWVWGVCGGGVSAAVRAWALENGDHPGLRIALCGYEGEHAMPDAWACVPWKAKGGYGSQGDARGRENAARERVWFSPHCLRPEAAQPSLFGGAA